MVAGDPSGTAKNHSASVVVESMVISSPMLQLIPSLIEVTKRRKSSMALGLIEDEPFRETLGSNMVNAQVAGRVGCFFEANDVLVRSNGLKDSSFKA